MLSGRPRARRRRSPRRRTGSVNRLCVRCLWRRPDGGQRPFYSRSSLRGARRTVSEKYEELPTCIGAQYTLCERGTNTSHLDAIHFDSIATHSFRVSSSCGHRISHRALTHTHPHTETHTHTQAHTHAHTLSLSLSLTHTHTRDRTFASHHSVRVPTTSSNVFTGPPSFFEAWTREPVRRCITPAGLPGHNSHHAPRHPLHNNSLLRRTRVHLSLGLEIRQTPAMQHEQARLPRTAKRVTGTARDKGRGGRRAHRCSRPSFVSLPSFLLNVVAVPCLARLQAQPNPHRPQAAHNTPLRVSRPGTPAPKPLRPQRHRRGTATRVHRAS